MLNHEHFFASNRQRRRYERRLEIASRKRSRWKERTQTDRKFDRQTLTAFCITAGMRRQDACRVAGTFVTWLDSNGAAWTNSRIKELRLWFEKYLAGEEYRPQWFATTKKGIPKGPLGAIFRLPLVGGLLVLSANSLLYEDPRNVSRPTMDKFLKALEGNGYTLTKGVREHLNLIFSQVQRFERSPWIGDNQMRLPVPQDIPLGKTIPLNGGTDSVRITEADEVERMLVYEASWKALPQATVEFLLDRDHLDWIPIRDIGNEYQLELDSHHRFGVGRLGMVLEPQMKWRRPAMANAITQTFLKPLGDFWYTRLRHLDTDCTFNQEDGISWVQSQLQQGHILSSVDMTSASDLLDLDACLEVVNTTYFSESRQREEYVRHIRHFHDISRGNWYDPINKKFVSWRQGQPLGTYPSFALMALTNNALCRLACYLVGIPLGSFRVLGDDVIIDARARDMYCHLVQLIGGEINHLKTVTSSSLVEFAGRVITARTSCNKVVNLRFSSDDSFMQYAAMIGPDCRKYLQPRQRRVWDELKYAPGILSGSPITVESDLGSITLEPVNGPWSQDSFGAPLALRYEWFLTYVLKSEIVPDPEPVETVGENLQKTVYRTSVSQEWQDCYLPFLCDEEAYQAPLGRKLPTGDPRRWGRQGRTLLEVLEDVIKADDFVSFPSFQQQDRSCSGLE